ncbi:MAG: MlaD family protein [Bacteroidales bacterium]|nr:MlaD family protein [Bacteroidales bacterium]
MKNSPKENIRLGLFVAIGIVIFTLGIYFIGSKRNIFNRSITISGVFYDISGIKLGNEVRFSGINIGTVSDVKILNDSLVQIDLSIQQDVTKFIRNNSKMEIVPEGLVGIKVVNIYSGTNRAPAVKDGDFLSTIETVKIDRILRQLNKSSVYIAVITKNVAEITNKINQGEGTLGKIFADQMFAENLNRIAKQTASLTTNIAEITSKISQEKGTIGMLLSDTSFAKKIYVVGENLKRSTQSLAAITSQVNDGKGILGELFTDTIFTSSLNRTGKNINYTTNKAKIISENLEKITDEINQGQGIISRLIFDTALADSIEIVINNVNKGAKEVEKAAVVVKRSWFIRLFSRKEKKKK